MLTSIILAAGASTRFGAVKQLQPMHANTMLNNAVAKVSQITEDHLVVVLGANADVIQTSLAGNVNYTVAKDWHLGMSASIRQGLGYLRSHYGDDMSHLLIALADQVEVEVENFERLKSAYQQHPDKIIASKYSGIYAVPAIFPKAFFAQLSSLAGKQGAKSVLNQNNHAIIGIDMPCAKRDIDTQQDLHDWQNSQSQKPS